MIKDDDDDGDDDGDDDVRVCVLRTSYIRPILVN